VLGRQAQRQCGSRACQIIDGSGQGVVSLVRPGSPTKFSVAPGPYRIEADLDGVRVGCNIHVKYHRGTHIHLHWPTHKP
jgi:hypothetical protein